MIGSDGTISAKTELKNWLGVSNEKNPRVVDGMGSSALLNEPNGCWAKTAGGKFVGLYIADTGNDCVRFADPSGLVSTVKLEGIPDVRETASDCVGGQCKADFGFSDDEEKKEAI